MANHEPQSPLSPDKAEPSQASSSCSWDHPSGGLTTGDAQPLVPACPTDSPSAPVNVTVRHLKANSAVVSWDVLEDEVVIGFAISQQVIPQRSLEGKDKLRQYQTGEKMVVSQK